MYHVVNRRFFLDNYVFNLVANFNDLQYFESLARVWDLL